LFLSFPSSYYPRFSSRDCQLPPLSLKEMKVAPRAGDRFPRVCWYCFFSWVRHGLLSLDGFFCFVPVLILKREMRSSLTSFSHNLTGISESLRASPLQFVIAFVIPIPLSLHDFPVANFLGQDVIFCPQAFCIALRHVFSFFPSYSEPRKHLVATFFLAFLRNYAAFPS